MFETIKLGKKIAEARKKVNISQAQLAERLFISPQAVGKWERGESMPNITTFSRLAEILGVDLNYFSNTLQEPTADTEPAKPVDIPSSEAPDEEKNRKVSWDLSHGNWVDADFSGLKNLHEKFSSSNMKGCRFNGSDLSGLHLTSNNVDSCDFSGSDISKSHIRDSNLMENRFIDCSIKESEFSGSNIDRCDFSGARLAGTEFSKTYLYGCTFNGADFTGVTIKSGGFTGVRVEPVDVEKNTITNAMWNNTSFLGSHIADLVFTGPMEHCYFENCTFTRVTFRNATLMNTFFKNNKNVKRICFIDCEADRMTFEFLKQGKADLTGITLVTEQEGGIQ